MTMLELDVFYPYPVETVWAALVVPEQVAAWFSRPESLEPAVGVKFRLHSRPNPFYSGVAYCEILAVEAPRLIRWSQSDRPDAPPTFTLTWTLAAEGDGTRLHLLQDGLEGLRGKLIGTFMGAGWKRILTGRLPAHLAARRIG